MTVLAVVAAACSPSGSPDATSTSAAVTASAANATTTAPNPAAAVTAATSTPAAAPPPATTARLGADLHDGAIDASFFGVEPIPATSDPRILDAAFGAVEELGVAHVGVNRVLWSDIEPDPPVDGVHDYDWSTLDAMADGG
ncbi:MAG: hypothetical protein ACE5GB_09580, partial [Acidimicrobiales bacterium]